MTQQRDDIEIVQCIYRSYDVRGHCDVGGRYRVLERNPPWIHIMGKKADVAILPDKWFKEVEKPIPEPEPKIVSKAEAGFWDRVVKSFRSR